MRHLPLLCPLLVVLIGPWSTARGQDEAPLSIALGPDIRLLPQLQYRPRVLAHGGRDFADGNTFDAASHRLRLGLEARLFQWGGLFVQIQDVRLWGEETDTLADYSADGLDLHQAWAELRGPLGLVLRVGRQEITLDGQRLVGAVGFTDQGRSFDAALLSLRSAGFWARAFWARLGEEDAFVADANGNPIKGAPGSIDLAGLWINYGALPALRPSLVGLFDRHDARERERFTLGVYLDGEPLPGLSYIAEFYYQLGKDGGPSGTDSPRKTLSAFLAAIRLGYSAPLAVKPGLEVWLDLLSGDGDPDDDTVRSFDTLYATNHKYYGLMDFFLNIPVHTGGRGLIDLGARLKLLPTEGLLLFVDLHHFRLARELTTTTGETVSALGNEVDLLARYAVNPHLSFETVFGLLVPQRAITCIRGGCRDDAPTELFGYLQANITL